MREPSFETLRVEAGGAVGRLTLSRPERLNALSGRCLRELAEAAAWFDSRRDVRVVIVGGEGRAFCAGGDVRGRVGPAEAQERLLDVGPDALGAAGREGKTCLGRVAVGLLDDDLYIVVGETLDGGGVLVAALHEPEQA